MSWTPPLLSSGWKWPSRPSHLLILHLLLAGRMASGYRDQECYCVEDEDLTIRGAVAQFTDTPPVSKFEYIGGEYNDTSDDFEPCVCNDVMQMMSELAVTEPYVLQLAAANSTQQLDANVTKAVDAAAKAAFSTLAALEHSYHAAFASYKETNDSTAIFIVDVIVKGSDTRLKEKVGGVMVAAVANNTLGGLGAVDNFTTAFTFRVCVEDPAGAGPDNTKVSLTNAMAGATATYTCDTGYRTNPGEASMAESVCAHETLTWTPPSPAITCVEDKRCHQGPPNPENTKHVWNGEIVEGTEITYRCRILHRTLSRESSTYICQGKVWTPLSSEINCALPKCEDPPQVPDHGLLIYNALDEITYQCDTYAIRSGINFVHKIWCKNSTWDELPDTFQCVGSDVYDHHQEWENFLNITLPVSAALVFVVILCLLCSRTDSPICLICKGSGREAF